MGLRDKSSRAYSNSWMISLHKSNDTNENRFSSSNVTGSNKFGIFATPDTNKQKISLATLRARVEEKRKNEDAPQLENFVSPKPTIINAVPPSNTPFIPRKLVSSDISNFT